MDSFLSLLFISGIILLAFFHTSQIQTNSWNSVDLRIIASDQLIVMEKGLVLEQAIFDQSSIVLQQDLNMTSPNKCFEISIFDNSNYDVPLLHATKSGCSESFIEKASVERTVFVDGNFFVAKLEGWVKWIKAFCSRYQ